MYDINQVYLKMQFSNMKDQLAARIKLGDEQAFELFFRKYYVRLCAFANKFLNDPDEAKDIVQEVFSKIWEGRRRN